MHWVFLLIDYKQFEPAVIDNNTAADRDVIGESVIVNIDSIAFLALRAVHRELQEVAHVQMEIHREVVGANRRALRVEQNRNWPIRRLGECPDARYSRAHRFTGGRAHIDPENIRAALDQLAQDPLSAHSPARACR